MLARSFRSRGGAALTTLAMAACASTAVPLSNGGDATLARMPSLTATSRVFDAERIRRSGAHTAWDAVRFLVPGHRFQSNRGSALGMLRPPDPRFESSVRLILDGHRMPDLDVLRAIPAREILAIHVLSPTEAAMYYGPVSGAGAIVIQTHSASHRF